MSNIYCPVCKTKLKVEGQRYLETLDEHVSCSKPTLKDCYVCPNDQCSTYNLIMWNKWGERYSKKYNRHESFDFIDKNDAPFNTFQRKVNVEIYKKDENRYPI